MTKRKRFLENLLCFINSAVGFFTIIIVISIIFGIVGFISFKQEPIPLTEKEITYYTNQAEIGYLKGVFYLDDNIEFIKDYDTTYNVYSLNQPEEKQKLKVTFSNDIVANRETYYSANLFKNTIVNTLSMAFGGFLLAVCLLVILDLLIRKKIYYNYDCPLNFSDEDE